MARKTNELNIDALNVSVNTRARLRKMSLSKVVSTGRCAAHHLERHPEAIMPKWKHELALAIKENGFIRHDLTDKTRCIINFYRSVHHHALRDFDESIYNDNNVFGSFYDSVTNISNDKIYELMEVINHLTKDERNVLVIYYGIMDGKPKGVDEISKILCMSEANVDHCRRRALGKICRNCELLPSIVF